MIIQSDPSLHVNRRSSSYCLIALPPTADPNPTGDHTSAPPPGPDHSAPPPSIDPVPDSLTGSDNPSSSSPPSQNPSIDPVLDPFTGPDTFNPDPNAEGKDIRTMSGFYTHTFASGI